MCIHAYITASFVGLCTYSRAECVTTGGLYRPTHMCVVHLELHKKSFTGFSCDVVRLGG